MGVLYKNLLNLGIDNKRSFLKDKNCFNKPMIVWLKIQKQYWQLTFESKQATMFVALDKLFALHNAMLLESRFIKALFIYSVSIFILYMFTSTKQTYVVRPKLYIGITIHIQFYGKQRNKDELWNVNMDSEMNWFAWVDTELPEDLDNLEDLDYILPEKVGENSVATTTTTKKYNFHSQQYHL
ncbi:unnamed protein product [Camellia sinensis]